MSTYSIIKNSSAAPSHESTVPVTANEQNAAVGKRVRFGSDSSDELTIQVREFELEGTENDHSDTPSAMNAQELATSNSASGSSSAADDPQIAADPQQSAPSSTSTSASSKYSPAPMNHPGGQANRDFQYQQHYMGAALHMPQIIPPPKRVSRLPTSVAQGVSVPMDDPLLASHEEIDLPIDHYMWADDTNSSLMYEEAPPLFPSRHRPLYDSRISRHPPIIHRRVPHTRQQVEDSGSEMSPDPAAQSSAELAIYKMPPSNVRSTTSTYQHVPREEFWREEPLPQGVPLILGPHGQWRLYHPGERNIVFDTHRGGWITTRQMGCECGNGRVCAQHRRRPNEWSDDEFEIEQQSYLPPPRKSRGDPNALIRRMYHTRQMYNDSAVAPLKTSAGRYDAGSGSGGWLNEANGAMYRY